MVYDKLMQTAFQKKVISRPSIGPQMWEKVNAIEVNSIEVGNKKIDPTR